VNAAHPLAASRAQRGALQRGALHWSLAMVHGFPRITIRAEQMGGVPCIRGMRIPVATVVGMLRAGMSPEEILGDFPDLEAEDLHEAVRFVEKAARQSDPGMAVHK
jgi:uncharacterized protein (DUF433 family)